MGDCGLTLPCDRHFRIKWWWQLMCSDGHGPAMNCGPGWWSRTRTCGQNAAIPPLHSSLCGFAVVAAAGSLLWCRRCSLLQAVLQRVSDSLLVQTSSDSYSAGASFSIGGWFGKQAAVQRVAAFPPTFHDQVRGLSTEWWVPVPSSAAKVPYKHGTWDLLSP